jgi:glycine cleavage system aminomethyltransferase T
MTFERNSPILKGAFNLTDNRGFLPWEFTGPKDEFMASRKTAWLGIQLNISPVYDVFGPDAIKFLNSVFVNRDFAKLKEGASRHGIICNETGQMLADGVIFKTEEGHYRSYWLAPVLQYYTMTSKLDVQGEYVIDEYFFQIDGPKSLEIMEKACQCDLHDLKFGHNKKVKICDTDMVIHRLGMSGALAYEVHGAAKNADLAYTRIQEVLEEFGGKRQGGRNYCTVNHTPAGYPNQFIHYMYPYFTSEKALAEFISKTIGLGPSAVLGSASDNNENIFLTPYDAGWGYLVNFDHDFIGKAALKKIAENPPRTVVTLEWNPEDVGDVFASQFKGKDVEPYDEIEYPSQTMDASTMGRHRADYVLAGDKKIGITSGKTYGYYEHRMISLAFIDKEYAAEGKDLIVLWGTPGRPQKKIRANVARFPYFNEEYRNETFDVEKIPHMAH